MANLDSRPVRPRWGQQRRRQLLLGVAPLAVGLVTGVATYAVRAQADDRFGHTVALMAQNDGSLGGFDNRNQAAELLESGLLDAPPADATVSVEPRFGTTLDIVVEAPTAADAASLAGQLAEQAVAERLANTRERFIVAIAAEEAALTDARAELEVAVERRDSLPDGEERTAAEREVGSLSLSAEDFERQIRRLRADLEGVRVPMSVTRSTADGLVAPMPVRDGALAALAASVATGVASAAVGDRRHRRDDG